MARTTIADKTRAQAQLEEKYNRPIKTIILDTLEKYRYHRNLTMNVATNLGIGLHTLYAWCRQYDIDIRSYRFATTRTDEFNPYAT